jgi:hypothetical protein
VYDYRIQYPNLNVAPFTPARFIRPEQLDQDVPVIRVDTTPLHDCVPGDVSPSNNSLLNAVYISARINLVSGAPIANSNQIQEVDKALVFEEFVEKITSTKGEKIDTGSIYDIVAKLNLISSPHRVGYVLSRVGDWNQIQLLMMEGKTIMVGGSVYESFIRAERTGVVPMPKPGEDLLGGHIVNLISIDREQEIVGALGNMGQEFGDRGRLKFRDAYIRNLSICRDFFVLIPRGLQNAA